MTPLILFLPLIFVQFFFFFFFVHNRTFAYGGGCFSVDDAPAAPIIIMTLRLLKWAVFVCRSVLIGRRRFFMSFFFFFSFFIFPLLLALFSFYCFFFVFNASFIRCLLLLLLVFNNLQHILNENYFYYGNFTDNFVSYLIMSFMTSPNKKKTNNILGLCLIAIKTKGKHFLFVESS